MPRPHIITIDHQHCIDFLNSRRVYYNGQVYYSDPYNGQHILESNPTCMKIYNHCQMMTTNRDAYMTNILNQWFQNPLFDPINLDNISWSLHPDSAYAQLYETAFTYLYETTPANDIFRLEDTLPKNHLLFNGKINLLFYNCLMDNVEEITESENHTYIHYQNYYDFIENIVSTMRTPRAAILTAYEDNILHQLCDKFIQILAHLITHIINCKYIDFSSLKNYVHAIEKDDQEAIFIYEFNRDLNTDNEFNLIVKMNDILDKIQQYHRDELYYIDYNKLYIDTLVNNLLQHQDVSECLCNHYKEIMKIYNYETNPDDSPFRNINLVPYAEMEDPLVKILNDLGIHNLDLVNLEIPNRPFVNDEEYHNFLNQFNNLKKEYEKQLEKFQSGKISERPERPSMTLPNGKSINVIYGRLPHYMKDSEYNIIVQKIKDNQNVIDMYKNLIDKGLLDLLSNVQITDVGNTFLNKDRQYFKDNVLFNNDNDKNKCNDNVDAANFTDRFDTDDYLLARLQLMYQLKSYDSNGDISRVDCFYAPNLYNTIVKKINDREVFTNTITGALINVSQVHSIVDELVEILRAVTPDLVVPRYRLPVHDINLHLKSSVVNRGRERFYEIYIETMIAHLPMRICDVCIIPADVTDQNMSSNKFLEKIKYLFENGFLLNKYVTPYCEIIEDNDMRIHHFFKTQIHFNNYSNLEQWPHDRQNKLQMYKHYFEEISKYA